MPKAETSLSMLTYLEIGPNQAKRDRTMTQRKNPQIGGRFDDWMKSEGIYEDATHRAIKAVLAWQLAQTMKAQNITKVEMARRLETSRAQLDRILDPLNTGVTLEALSRAAHALGRKLRLELV